MSAMYSCMRTKSTGHNKIRYASVEGTFTQGQDIKSDGTGYTSRMHPQHCRAPSPVGTALRHNRDHPLSRFSIQQNTHCWVYAMETRQSMF
uniref:Uncharacterized protein n=1 Tax=Rhipicephalus zambeziensis TaxID=60191 RepID=A0A224YAH4_9ACAR